MTRSRAYTADGFTVGHYVRLISSRGGTQRAVYQITAVHLDDNGQPAILELRLPWIHPADRHLPDKQRRRQMSCRGYRTVFARHARHYPIADDEERTAG